jgi:hypothetical protein
MGRPRRRAKPAPTNPAPAAGAATTEESIAEELGEEVLEFLRAIDDYRRLHGRPFPTWTEVLRILHGLGYRKGEEGEERAVAKARSRSG